MKGSALAACLLALPAAASACPVCFGKSVDSAGFFQGLTIGIIVLIGFTFAILGALTAAVIRIERSRELSQQRRAVAR